MLQQWQPPQPTSVPFLSAPLWKDPLTTGVFWVGCFFCITGCWHRVRRLVKLLLSGEEIASPGNNNNNNKQVAQRCIRQPQWDVRARRLRRITHARTHFTKTWERHRLKWMQLQHAPIKPAFQIHFLSCWHVRPLDRCRWLLSFTGLRRTGSACKDATQCKSFNRHCRSCEC